MAKLKTKRQQNIYQNAILFYKLMYFAMFDCSLLIFFCTKCGETPKINLFCVGEK